MEDEIDLREYLELLIKHWKWIAALTLIAGLVAAAISFFVLQPTYEAKALILITNPRYQLRFDPRLETVSDIQTTSKAYPSLATSDDLLGQVLETLNASLPQGERTLQALRNKVSARAGADPSLLELKVTSNDREQAAYIANTWAERYVEHVNELYGRRGQDVTFFNQQLEIAQSALEAAEEALVAYEARNQELIARARLEAKQSALSDYLAVQHELTLRIEDARTLRQQLEQQPATDTTSLGYDLAALLLEIRGLSQDTELPLQLQVVGGESLSNKTVGEQARLLGDLITALEGRLAETETQIEKLSAELLPLQEALQQAKAEKERWTRERDVARNTYMTLANKVEEARIAAQDETGEVRLASRAAVPTRPVGPRKLMNTAIAGFLGLFVGIFAAFFVEYWRSPREAAS